MSFSAYDGAAYRTATAVYAYDGSAWRTATGVWVYDGGSWRQGFTNASISALSGKDVPHDPTLGVCRLTWTYSGDVSAMLITLDADFAGGTTYGYNVDSAIDPTLGTYDTSLNGVFGFSTLDTTNFRMRLMDGATIVSELTVNGPYAFL